MIRRPGTVADGFRRSRCRVAGCRVKTRCVYSVVIAPGVVVMVHLCPSHAEARHWTPFTHDLKPVKGAA